MRREMQRGRQCREEHGPSLKLQEKTHEEQEMVIKSQLPWGQKVVSIVIAWPVLLRAESANSRPGSLRDEEVWSCFLCPPILVKSFSQSWAFCYADCPQLTQLSSPHPDFPFSMHPVRGNEMQCCFVHFSHHQSCPQNAHTIHCSTEVRIQARASEHPLTSPDWICQPISQEFS